MTVSGFSKVLNGNIEYESIKNAISSGRLPMGVIGLNVAAFAFFAGIATYLYKTGKVHMNPSFELM